MTLLLRARLHKTKAVIFSEYPYWAVPVLLDEESKRRPEMTDKPRKEVPTWKTHQ